MSAIVKLLDGKVVADSRDVAQAFGKMHKNVVRDIDVLISGHSGCGLKFEPTSFSMAMPNGGKRHVRCFLMTRTGFMLLVMGFGGAKALALKLEWIEAFERMEAALQTPALPDPPEPPIVDMEDQRGALAFVREARILGGRAAGRRAWSMAGLPDVFDDDPPPLPPLDEPVLDDWLRARVEQVAGARTASGVLYADYHRWCGEGGHDPISVKRFGQALTRAGIVGVKSNGIQRLGVRLRPGMARAA